MFCFPHPTEEWTGLLNKKISPTPPGEGEMGMAKIYIPESVSEMIWNTGLYFQLRWVVETT